MNPFKGRHFQRDIILWAVRWYCKYGISYRELRYEQSKPPRAIVLAIQALSLVARLPDIETLRQRIRTLAGGSLTG
jgi:IS6 family transposase